MTGMFKNIVRTDGYRGLYRGLFANLLKMVPAVSINYVVYEEVKGWLGVGIKGE